MKIKRILLFWVALCFPGLASATSSQGLILISLDGFARHYLDRYPAPALQQLIAEGTVAEAMQPVFPSKTFPNHYSIVTGLYPAKHGIVENNIYDSGFDAIFRLSLREEVANPRWWLGEPIWVTAEKQGKTAATFFYPGSEAAIRGIRPSKWQVYDGDVSNTERVQGILKWLDLPAAQRPKFLTLYFSTVDDAGHAFGPDAPQTAAAVAEVDRQIALLVEGLKQRQLYGKIDVMIVSDHGMAAVTPQNTIPLDQLFDTKQAALVLWTPEIVSIFPKPGKLDSIYRQLQQQLPAHAKVYKKAELPARWYYQDSNRIAPLIVVPEAGWRLMQQKRQQQWLAEHSAGQISGSHGYDNQHPTMQAIFIGQGPSFAAGRTIPAFANIQLYNLMCRILGITPATNDGDPAWVGQMLEPKTPVDTAE
ncbi:MAG: ectonucleotide pyrophosphatase/phosphodiesterase [Gammaproteobacteria bacterium]|nr:ectonucleotide pyrophosphatase/phosphodiesterase [Gammaproteobacteria bacterium]